METNIDASPQVVSFGERLVAAGRMYGRLCVGIDPHPALLQQWGLPISVDGLRSFSMRCVEAFAGNVALVKPQVAFYERFGSQGFAVLEQVLAALRETKTLVVADAKRGDIGSTMAGYARAWLAPGSPLEADSVTVTPYLGVGALEPAIELGKKYGKGLFVMAANSNSEAAEFQSATLHTHSGESTVAQLMVDQCAACNAEALAQGLVGDVGVVVGATVADPPVLSCLNAAVLLPGVGAQGGTIGDVDRIMGPHIERAFPSVSRSILSHGPSVSELRKEAVSLARGGV